MKLKPIKRDTPDPLLTPSEDIDDDTGFVEHREVVLELARQLLKNKLESLSAPQLGVNLNIFVTYIRGDWFRVFINPEVEIKDYDQDEVEETCASYPRKKALRWRYRSVKVRAWNTAGEKFVLNTGKRPYPKDIGLRLAYIIQHEMEHLNGRDVRVKPLLPLAEMGNVLI